MSFSLIYCTIQISPRPFPHLLRIPLLFLRRVNWHVGSPMAVEQDVAAAVHRRTASVKCLQTDVAYSLRGTRMKREGREEEKPFSHSKANRPVRFSSVSVSSPVMKLLQFFQPFFKRKDQKVNSGHSVFSLPCWSRMEEIGVGLFTIVIAFFRIIDPERST